MWVVSCAFGKEGDRGPLQSTRPCGVSAVIQIGTVVVNRVPSTQNLSKMTNLRCVYGIIVPFFHPLYTISEMQ